jgi:hypothetical protein
MNRRRGLILVAVAVLMGAACTSGNSDSSSTTSGSEPAADTPTGIDLARRVSLQESDVAPANTVELIEDGDRVVGEVTLDLCGADFASEQRRKVRYQVETVTAEGENAAVSSEAVIYDSREGAQQALDEVRRAQESCPAGLTDSKVPGIPPVTTVFGPAPDAAWPQVPGIDRVVQDVTVTAEDGRSFHKVLVFQVRDAMLVGVYVTPETAPAQLDPSIGTVEGLVAAVGDRLAALPAAALANASAI